MAGKLFYDENKAKWVRDKVLDEVREVLNETPKSKKFGAYKKEMLLKLAMNVLPRLHAGRTEDEPLFADFLKKINESDTETKTESKE